MSDTGKPQANQPELQHRRRIQTPCPNSRRTAYVMDGGQASRPQISVETFRGRLAKLDLKPGSVIRSHADRLAAKCRIEPTELLHMAICRAARPGASRPDIDILPFLIMLMRSIVSGIAKARRRAAERGVSVPFDLVHEQVPSGGSIRDPFRMIERAREQDYFAGLLEELHCGDPKLANLIDAIGMNLRGHGIQRELGLGLTELASLRRRLKRKATQIMVREGLLDRQNAERPVSRYEGVVAEPSLR